MVVICVNECANKLKRADGVVGEGDGGDVCKWW